jgi:chitodextrinase
VTEYGVVWDTRGPKALELTPLPTFTKTRLTCGTTYSVQVIAFDAARNHSQKSSEAIVSTAACADSSAPTKPSGVAQIARTQTTATLGWSASSDNVGVTGYAVSLGGVEVGTTAGTSYTLTGLTCGSWYTAVVQAYDAGGNRSEPVSFAGSTASCPDKSPPAAPSGLSQVSGTTTSLTISWVPAAGASSYGVYVGASRVGETSSANTTIPALACGTTYSIGVDAADAAGNRSARTTAQATTAACPSPSGHSTVADTTSPTTPSGLAVATVSQNSVSIRWASSTDNVGVVGYSVYKDGAPAGNTTGTTFLVSSVTCGTTVVLGVEARDAAGNRSARTTAQLATAPCPPSNGHSTVADTTSPTTPSSLAVTTVSQNSVSIRWASSTDNVGVVGYSVYRNGVPAGETTGTTFLVPSVTCGTTVVLGVEARDAAGNRSRLATVSAAAVACTDTSAPTMPGPLTMQNRTETSLTFSWLLSTDKVGVVGYGIYLDGKLVGSTTEGQYTLARLTCGNVYTVGVDAFDAAGNRSASSTTLLVTAACPDLALPPRPIGITLSNVAPSSLTVAWTSGGGTTAGFGVYLGTTLVGSTQGTTYAFSGLTCGTQYTVGVDAYDAGGRGSSRLSLSANTASCAASGPTPSGGIYVTPSGSDSNPCTQAQPCRSFGRAYKAAAPGATVLVGTGTYPGQEISDDPAKSSGPSVVFQPFGGAVTVAGTIDFGQAQFDRQGPKGVTIKDMTVKYLRAWEGSERLLWENIDAVHFDMDATDSTVRGGDYGPCQAPRDDASCLSRVLGTSRNVLVEDASFHNVTSTDLANYHVDGFAVFGGENVTLRSNKFYGNMITNIRVQNCCGNTPIRNLVIENNWFAASLQGDGVSTNANGLDIDSSIPGLQIRFNSFAEGGYPQITGAQSDARLTGNLLTQVSCLSGVTYAYNVFKPWSDVQGQNACSSTDKKVSSLGYSSGGFSLSSSSPAIDYVPSSVGCPDQDLEGRARPLGVGCDAGASELR